MRQAGALTLYSAGQVEKKNQIVENNQSHAKSYQEFCRAVVMARDCPQEECKTFGMALRSFQRPLRFVRT
jgi:hypothetical protein